MSEQLSLDFSVAEADTPAVIENESTNYEALDFQLADLMLELNGETNQTLKDCTLEISKHTREGQIAIACSDTQESELLKTRVVGGKGDYKPLILDNGYLYLRRYWQYQQQLAERIQSRFGQVEQTESETNWQKERLEYYFKRDTEAGEINWQQVAAERALSHQFLILSGGPGTGKTTTITRILALLIEQLIYKNNEVSSNTSPKSGDIIESPISKNEMVSSLKIVKKGGGVSKLSISLAAPTGKAAIRMLDAIREAQQKMNLPEAVQAQMPSHASTIHKLLGYIHESVQFKHNRHHPLNADVVLVDEASMIDIALMSKLVEAVPAHAKLILIGDKDQLSSVETGSVFADMCEGLSSLSPTGGGLGVVLSGVEVEGGNKIMRGENLVTLQKNWRFKKDSGIGQLAIAANSGDSEKLLEILRDESKPDCDWLSPETLSNNQIPDELISPWKNYSKVLNNPDSSIVEIFAAFNQYRILCALRRGLNGSTIMSERIETSLAKQGLIKLGKSKNKRWYHGRPVMITQNSYSKGLFNGDTGITLIRNGELKVFFPDDGEEGFKYLAPVRLPSHETTWAMTIHKSQGSEFNQVALILPHEVMPLLTRQLIYTGITRARKVVKVISDKAVLVAGVKSNVVKATRIEDLLATPL